MTYEVQRQVMQDDPPEAAVVEPVEFSTGVVFRISSQARPREPIVAIIVARDDGGTAPMIALDSCWSEVDQVMTSLVESALLAFGPPPAGLLGRDPMKGH